MELLPANISQLSLAPGPHSGNSSPTERTTIKIVLDSDIEYWDKKKKQAQLDIDTVDKLLTLMDEDTRKVLSKRFCEGKRIKDIGIECDYSESQVYRMISEALDSEL